MYAPMPGIAALAQERRGTEKMRASDQYQPKRCGLRVASWLALTTCLATPSLAQVAENNAQQARPSDGGEIIVTATRRQESVQDIPFSITALTGDKLQDLGAETLRDFAEKVAGLEYASFAPGLNRITVRGISTQTGESSVGFYIDEMPITADPTAQPDVGIYDVNRVEVLRGPQGTLFGESSLGGTIRIITNRPDTSAFAGSAEATVSNTDDGGWNYVTNAMVNIPLVEDKLALRVVGGWHQNSGYIDNVLLGQSDVNEEEGYNFRVILGWTPSDALTVLASYMGSEIETDGEFIANENLDQFRFTPENRKDNFQRVNLTIEYETDFADFISSTSYFDRDTDRLTDQTGATFGLLPPGATLEQLFDIDSEVFAQEVRIASNRAGPIDWVIGGFFKNNERTLMNSADATPSLGGPLLASDDKLRFRQWAVFGEAVWHITEQLDFTAGLRYFQENDRFETNTSGLLAGPGLSNVETQESNEFAPRFSLKYAPTDNVNLYATASRGFRAGGANPTKPVFDVLGVPLPVAYQPDTLWNYELGLKSQMFDNRLLFNVAGYYMDWQDIQLPITAGVGFNGTFNGGDAESKGVEVELVATPFDRLTIDFSGNYTDATLSETITVPFPAGPMTTIDVPVAVEGNKLPLVPEWKASVGIEYEVPINDDWSTVLRADASFIPERFNFADNNPAEVLEGYQLVNLQAAFRGPMFDIVLFVDNAANDVIEYAFQGDPSLPMERFFYAGRPRTVGVTLRTEF